MLIGSRLAMQGGGVSARTKRYAEYYLKIASGTIEEIDDEDTVDVAQYAFYENRYVRRVSFRAAETVGSSAFSKCTALECVEIPRISIAKLSMLNGCTALVDVEMPNVVSVDASVFKDCSALERIRLPRAISFGWGAFMGCTGLKTLDLPRAENLSFAFSSSYTRLNLLRMDEIEKVPTLSSGVFDSAPATMRIVVPDALVDAMRAASNWSAYADRIVGVTEYDAANGGAR